MSNANNTNGAHDAQPEYHFGNPPPQGNEFVGNLVGVPPAPVQDPSMRDYRGYSLAQPFNLVERIRCGRPMFGYGLLLGSPYLARITGAGGYDFIFIDWEHTPMSIREVTELIRWVQYASEGTTATVVRVPNADHQWIAWVLDAGASAVLLPHTETAEQARRMVKSAKFPMMGGGQRSYPPAALAMGINDGAAPGKLPYDVWNNAAVIIQIESQKGCENADEIAAVEVDALMIGNGDLRLDLGLAPALDGPEPIYNQCIKNVLDASKKHKRPVWTFTTSAADIEKRLGQGFTGFVAGADAMAIGAAMRKTLNETVNVTRQWEKNGSEVKGVKW